MSGESDKTGKITFDKKALSSRNKGKIEVGKTEVEVPELNVLMGLEEGEICVMVVRQMHFDELVSTQQDQLDFVRNLIEGIMEASSDRNAVKEEVQSALARNRIASQKIDIVQTCLVDPKLSRSEVVYISKMFPSVILRLYNTIMTLTNKGADLKKNSTG
jgi:hypothetical protein